MRPRFSLRQYRGSAPLLVIAGPCVLESPDEAREIARFCAAACAQLGLPYVFKASFDKANRTSASGGRGPGLDGGLATLAAVKEQVQVPVLTDVHTAEQAEPVSHIADVLQIPAFLCRQTDLVVAAARAASVVAVKKGQFLSPWDTRHIAAKVRGANPACEVVLTERGASFGYNNLVVDMRSFPVMKEWADLVVFDATHSLQLPGAGAGRTAGQREFIPHLAQAAVATGAIDGIFLEVHPEPSRSPSDADNILPLAELPALLARLVAVARAVATAGAPR